MALDGQLEERGEIRRRRADGEHGAALLDELAQPGQRALHRRTPDLILVLGRQVRDDAVGASGATTTAATTGCAGNRAVHEDEDVVLVVQVAAIELRCEDAPEAELELLQEPARPACGHRATVRVPQPDARRAKFRRIRGRRRGGCVERDAELLRTLLHDARCRRRCMHVKRTGGIHGAAHRHRRAQSQHFLIGLEQPVERDERIVGARASEESRRIRDARNLACRRRDGPRTDLLERPGESIEDAIELHTHLVSERPSGVVVRRRRRPTRNGEDVRMHLRLEHVHHVRTERLRRLHDVRARRILLAGDGEIARRSMHRDARLEQRIDEFRRRGEVRLVRRDDVAAGIAQFRRLHRRPLGSVVGGGHPIRDGAVATWVRRPCIAAAALDGALAHPVEIVEHVLLHARRVVEHRAVERDRVVDGLPEVPLLRRDGHRDVAGRNLARQHERNAHRRRAADDFRQHRDGVVKRRRVADAAIPPAVIRPARSHRRTGLSLHRQTRVHRRAQRLNPQHEDGVEVVVVRVAKRWRIHDGARWSALVMIVEDLRKPLVVENAVLVLRLGLRGHEEVAIVVVADVLLVQPRQLRHRPLLRIRIAHVPVGDEIVAVGIRVNEEDNDVVEDAHGLLVGLAHHVVHHLAELLCADDFGGVESAVDPHDCLAFLRECARLRIGESLRVREARRDVLEAREPLVIRGRRHDGHEMRTAFSRLAHLVEHHAIGLAIQRAPVRGHLPVACEEVVVAEVGAECFHGRRDAGLRAGERRERQCERQRERARARQREHGRFWSGEVRRITCGFALD